MSREYKVYLQDIISSIEKIESYTNGVDFEKFKATELIVDGVVRNLEIIGEAAKNVPAEIKTKHLTVEWKKLAGLRDILIHAYFGVDVEILWDIIQNKLAGLKKELLAILSS